MERERTFAILKPGVLQRRLAGEIIARIEKNGFRIVGMKLIKITNIIAEQHYREHQNKSFFDGLKKYITSEPVVVMVLERTSAVSALRKLCGATDPGEAEAGTIRGDYGVIINRNIIHASDSEESAEREIEIFFTNEEIKEFNDGNEQWY